MSKVALKDNNSRDLSWLVGEISRQFRRNLFRKVTYECSLISEIVE